MRVYLCVCVYVYTATRKLIFAFRKIENCEGIVVNVRIILTGMYFEVRCKNVDQGQWTQDSSHSQRTVLLDSCLATISVLQTIQTQKDP
jgi:hypothetical protein